MKAIATRHARMAAMASVSCLALAALNARAEESAPSSAPIAVHTKDLSVEELERLLAPLDGSDRDAMAGANRSLDKAGASAIPAVSKKLAELRKAPSAPIAAAVKRATGDRGSKATDFDLSAALLGVEEAPASVGLRAARTTAMLAGFLARIGTPSAIRELVRIAGDHEGIFRFEVARHVRVLREKAVPALIDTRAQPSAQLRAWASTQLDSMGKRIASDAVQTTDRALLVDVLGAYGRVRDLDAVPVLLSFANTDREEVRFAARDALQQVGQDAVWKVREAYTSATGKAAPDGWTAADVLRGLFAEFDRVRLQEIHALLDKGLADTAAGKADQALVSFDKILTQKPMLERRSEMAPAYVTRAMQLEETDSAQALALLEKARRLLADGDASQVDAEIAYLEGRRLRERGVPDEALFRRALSLDPNHAKARTELDTIEALRSERENRTRAVLAAIAAFVLALVIAILFAGIRRPRRTALAPRKRVT